MPVRFKSKKKTQYIANILIDICSSITTTIQFWPLIFEDSKFLRNLEHNQNCIICSNYYQHFLNISLKYLSYFSSYFSKKTKKKTTTSKAGCLLPPPLAEVIRASLASAPPKQVNHIASKEC